jgi:hypothetical protein
MEFYYKNQIFDYFLCNYRLNSDNFVFDSIRINSIEDKHCHNIQNGNALNLDLKSKNNENS